MAAGQPREQAEHARDVQTRLFEIIESTTDQAEQSRQVDELMAGDTAVADQIKSGLPMLNKPWYRYFATYDPAPTLEKLKIPVLALHGAKDIQVDPTQNMPANQAALRQGKKPDATVRVVPGVNHFSMTALPATSPSIPTSRRRSRPPFSRSSATGLKSTQNKRVGIRDAGVGSGEATVSVRRLLRPHPRVN
jgi:hypothetical protein